jgi:hypothetical protein
MESGRAANILNPVPMGHLIRPLMTSVAYMISDRYWKDLQDRVEPLPRQLSPFASRRSKTRC